jgi:hypothetical protein
LARKKGTGRGSYLWGKIMMVVNSIQGFESKMDIYLKAEEPLGLIGMSLPA